MTVTQNKRMGRPRKSSLEKGEQFSIRLNLPTKALLEMMARDKGISLSQAVQHLIEGAAGSYKIDGKTLSETLYERMISSSKVLKQIDVSATPEDPKEALLEQQTAIFNSKAAPLFLMPERLLRPNELALVRACFGTGKLPSDEDLDFLDFFASNMIALGRSVDETTEALAERIRLDRQHPF